jgi:hypothetical protein
MNDLVSFSEAKRQTGISRQTIWRRTKTGELTLGKGRTVSLSEIERYQGKRRPGPVCGKASQAAVKVTKSKEDRIGRSRDDTLRRPRPLHAIAQSGAELSFTFPKVWTPDALRKFTEFIDEIYRYENELREHFRMHAKRWRNPLRGAKLLKNGRVQLSRRLDGASHDLAEASGARPGA